MSITAIATGFDEMLDVKPAPVNPVAPQPAAAVEAKPEPVTVSQPEKKVETVQPEQKPAVNEPTSEVKDDWTLTDFDDILKILQSRKSSKNDLDD